MSAPPAARLWDQQRRHAAAVDHVREGAHGQLVLRLTRKRPNHPAYDAAEDRADDELLSGFTGWLEHADGRLVQVVRLSAPRGAELLDVGKWAVEYATVAGGHGPERA